MIRLGIIGFGHRTQGVLKNFRDVDSDIKIAGIVDTDKNGCLLRLDDEDKDQVVFYDSLDQMVSNAKPDGLVIGTRCDSHSQYAVEAAKYDLPLFLEKPVAITQEQALSLERAFENSRCEVVVSFPLRVSALCQFAKEKIEAGAVGACEHVCAVNYVAYGTVYWEEPYRNYDITQGLLLQKATHDFDYITYLMESPIVRVGAMETKGHVFGGNKPKGLVCSKCDEQDTCLESPQNRKRNCSSELLEDHLCVFGADCKNENGETNEDSSSVLMEFASGAHGVYTQVFFTRRDARQRGAVISGYHGTLSFDWYKNELKHVQHHAPFTNISNADCRASHFGGDAELAADFVGLIKGENKSRCTIWDGIASVNVCLAAKESIAKGKFVNVRQVVPKELISEFDIDKKKYPVSK
jgi:predicted dehydrogenase